MFRIRRIHEDVLPINRTAIDEVQKIFFEHFSAAPPEDIQQLGERLRNPFNRRFRTVLYVAESQPGQVQGFAIVLHDPVLLFCYLDYLAAGKKLAGRGVGAALYEYVRDESLGMGAHGLFFECLPDDPVACPDAVMRKENTARLRFYERYGARPFIGTSYEAPIPGTTSTCLPHLVYDPLGQQRMPKARWLREVVRAILERKYPRLCPPEYVNMVVASFRDPLQLREPKNTKSPVVAKPAAFATRQLVVMTVNDRHDIHHIRERGYVESPVRIKALLSELVPSGLVKAIPVKEYPIRHIKAVHDSDYVEYLKRACAEVPAGKSVYPYVFPVRNHARRPKELSIRAGYYCIDTFTPLNANAFRAARRAVDCTLTAADELLAGRRVAYSLVRPPGHHAERKAFGGFCYFNNAAIAAHYLSAFGKVAMLDIDYHHGNGQQDIFYERPDVLTISIHGHPEFAYPYFTGFANERGGATGAGYNLNIPLPESQNGEEYRRSLDRACKEVAKFAPSFLIVPLGLDPAKGDPTGTWSLVAKDFELNGRMIGQLQLPTLVVQEGGYRTRTLGNNAKFFFTGLVRGAMDLLEKTEITLRDAVVPTDRGAVRAIVERTGFFRADEVDVAVELVDERLARGAVSGYHFVFAEHGDSLAGYACYGPIACTVASFDLYWIAVDPQQQRHGIGKLLMRAVEERVLDAGGARIYVDTSGQAKYEPTRAFYERCGFHCDARLADFYAAGDDRVIYVRLLCS